jgi:beta-glucosidase
MSWPRALGQAPIWFGQRPSGRPFDAVDYFTSKYLDVPNEPLYPFGHGLSYGRFRYTALRVTPRGAARGDTIEAEVDLVNEAAREAEETVFLFSRDRVASVTRPLLELRAFGKISLRPGESGTLKLRFAASELGFLGQDLRPVFEAGEVELLAGPNADRRQLLSALITVG